MATRPQNASLRNQVVTGVNNPDLRPLPIRHAVDRFRPSVQHASRTFAQAAVQPHGFGADAAPVRETGTDTRLPLAAS